VTYLEKFALINQTNGLGRLNSRGRHEKLIFILTNKKFAKQEKLSHYIVNNRKIAVLRTRNLVFT
jgi:hypothetical protein